MSRTILNRCLISGIAKSVIWPFPQHAQILSTPVLCSILFREGFHFDGAVLLRNLLQSCLGQFLCLHPLAMSHIFLLICLVSFCIDPDELSRIELSCGEYLLAPWVNQGLQCPVGVRLWKPSIMCAAGLREQIYFVLSSSMILMAWIEWLINAGVLDHSLERLSKGFWVTLQLRAGCGTNRINKEGRKLPCGPEIQPGLLQLSCQVGNMQCQTSGDEHQLRVIFGRTCRFYSHTRSQIKRCRHRPSRLHSMHWHKNNHVQASQKSIPLFKAGPSWMSRIIVHGAYVGVFPQNAPQALA